MTNCLEALIGAGLAHRLSAAPDRFDTLGRAALFMFTVVLVAPVVSGFVDAAAVAVLRGEPYWTVSRTRFFSNTLTALAVVPVIVSLVQAWPAPPRRAIPPAGPWRPPRWSCCSCSSAGAIFAHPLTLADRPLGTGGRSRSSSCCCPLLLWAATRFGAAGSSCALLCTALLAFLAATSHEATASAGEAAQDVRVLQAFLLVAGIPLFALGALMEERRSIEQALEERLRFEAFLSRLSGAFVHLPGNAMDTAFEAQLRQVGEHADLRYVLLFRVSADRQRLEPVSSWSAGGQASAWPPSRGSLPSCSSTRWITRTGGPRMPAATGRWASPSRPATCCWGLVFGGTTAESRRTAGRPAPPHRRGVQQRARAPPRRGGRPPQPRRARPLPAAYPRWASSPPPSPTS